MKKKTDSHAEQLISLREFARRMAVTEKTIRDAIVKSKIVEGVFYKDGKPKIRFEIAKKEFEVLGVGYRSYLKNDDAPINSVNEQEKEEDDPDAIAGLTGASTLGQAQRAEKIFKAQLAYLELEKEKGALVDRDQVFRTLFAFGNEMKAAFQALPERITDDLISKADDRNEFYNHLTQCIDDELLRLSQIYKLKL